MGPQGRISNMVTVPKVKKTFCAAKDCKSTPSTRSPSTRLARPPCTHKGSAATTVSSRVTVVRPSLFPQEGQDHQEDRAASRVCGVQVQIPLCKRSKHFELVDKKK